MSNTILAAAVMHHYAYLDDQDVVEMVLSLPSVISDSHYIVISSNDQTLVGKKYNRQTGNFEDIMFYYAILDAKDIVTQVVALEAEVTDPKKILLTAYDQSLVGKWYNRTTKQFTALPIHILAKLSTGEINILNADGTPQDKWLQTKLDEIDTKVSQVESNCITDSTAKYNEVNTKIAQVESKCLGDSLTKYNQLDTKITQTETRCSNDTATKFNYLNTKVSQVENGSFGAYKAKFRIEDNQEITSAWRSGKRYTFNFDSGISGYFPKMIRLVDRSGVDGDLLKADLYIVKNADGSIKNAYVDKKYISAATGKTNEKYGQSIGDSLFNASKNNGNIMDEGGSYFMGGLPTSSSFYINIGDFTYTENSISFTMEVSEEVVGRYTIMDFNGFVY